MNVRPSSFHPPRCAAGFALALAVTLSAIAAGATKQATDSSSLRGTYYAHDLYESYGGGQDLGRGFRIFNADGQLTRIFTYPASTPLSFEIATDATFRLYAGTYDGGFAGTIGLGGELAVFSRESPPNADGQLPGGYASLQISVKQGSGLNAGAFAGDYSYHALQRAAGGAYLASFGGATANGAGSYFLVREDRLLRTYSYSVASDGRMALGRQESSFAAMLAGGDLIVNTAQLRAGDDGEIPGGYTGLALYVRRFPDGDAATDDFLGTYRIHQIAANGTATPRAEVGAMIAGGAGYFTGTLGGTPYEGQIALNGTGTFTFDEGRFRGTLGAGGNAAVVTGTAAGTPSLALWIRTAGGPGNSLDRDGDGLTDAEEIALGTNPDRADTDGDGLLDNEDPRPTIPDNIVSATLSQNAITFDEGGVRTAHITLTLDSDDFPFFAWSLRSNVPWLSFGEASGFGDTGVAVRVDAAQFTAAGSPYRAEISVDAPAMAPVAPIPLTLTVASSQPHIAVAPSALAFTLVEGGASAEQTVSISSPDGDDFAWTAQETPPWLTVTPGGGTGPAAVRVEVDPATLRADASPYRATVAFVPGGAGPNPATVDVAVAVVPPRDLDTPFPAVPSENAQSDPALAFDAPSGQWLLAWVEEEQIWAAIFDENLVPLAGPMQLSFTALGMAANPAVVLVDSRREAWVFWDQRETGTSDALIQARPIDLGTRAPGNGFGFSTTAGDKTRPAATHNANNDEVLIVFDQEFEDRFFVGMARMRGATRRGIATGFPAANSNPQRAPAAAWLGDVNQYLAVWRETVTADENDTRDQVRALRLDGATGNPLGDPIIIDADAPRAAHLRVVAAQGLGRWVVAWSEFPFASQPGHLQALSVAADGTPGPPHSLDTMQRFASPAEVAYNRQSGLLTCLWSRNPAGGNPLGVYRHATGRGQPLGGPVALPGNPTAAASGAVGANPDLNEFLLVWEDPQTIPRQLRALRIAGGSEDLDGDGLPNDWEIAFGLDPGSAEGDDGADGDPDRDGLTNLAEYRLGTDPTNPDTDGDGLLDGQEDTNGDGVIEAPETSPLNPDTDGDGVTDDVEWFRGSDGSDPESTPATGIVRIDYGPWSPGEPGTLTASFYVADPGYFGLQVNPGEGGDVQAPPGWRIDADDDGGLRFREQGVHFADYTITPAADLTAANAYGTFHVVLHEDGAVADSRTAVLVAELLETYEGTGDLAPDALARTYAPLLRLHRDAYFAPIPVELSLGTAAFHIGNQITLRVPPAEYDLQQSPYTEACVDLPGSGADALFAAYPEPENRPAPTLYYTVAKLGNHSEEPGANPGHIALQFYMHFYADLWGLDQAGGHHHEGDWEVFQILLDEDGRPYRASATQQWPLAQVDTAVAGGESRPWERVERHGTRPILYVAQGGNSLYFSPGATRYDTGRDLHDGLGHWMVPGDGAGTFGAAPDYDRNVVMTLTPLHRPNAPDATRWLRFPGRWGQPAYPIPEGDSAHPPVQDGPVGPVFLGTTRDPEDATGVARIWADPFAFAARMPERPPEIATRIRGALPLEFGGQAVLLMDARGRVYFGDIDPDTGAFDVEASVQHYALAAVALHPTARPALLAMVRFRAGALESPLFAATAGATELGSFALVDGLLLGPGNFHDIDTDGDGIVDSEDPDIDGDGIENAADDDVLGDGWADAFQLQDRNGNGIPRFLDPDDMDDGQGPADRDGDGFIDAIDLDQDNDGYDDATEIAAGSDPRHYLDTPVSRVGDLDGDGDVDAADGQQLLNQILGRAPYDPRADYNLDGAIDAFDLQRLINDILAGSLQ